MAEPEGLVVIDCIRGDGPQAIDVLVMDDSKEIERSLWPGGRAGIECKKGVCAKGGVVNIAVREGVLMLPAGGILSRGGEEEEGRESLVPA